MADAGLLGLAAAIALPAAYVQAAGRGRRMGRALAAALACYAAVAAGLGGLPEVGTAGRVAIAAAAIVVADRRAGRRVMVEIEARKVPRSKWGALPGALVPAACLMAVTALRDSAGAAWAGLLTPFPAATLALLVATHAEAGSAAACRVAAAVPRGSFGTLAFLATFRSLVPALGPAWGAAWGVAAAVAALLAVGAITARGIGRPARRISTGIGNQLGEAEEPRESPLPLAGVPILPRPVSRASCPGRVHGRPSPDVESSGGRPDRRPLLLHGRLSCGSDATPEKLRGPGAGRRLFAARRRGCDDLPRPDGTGYGGGG